MYRSRTLSALAALGAHSPGLHVHGGGGGDGGGGGGTPRPKGMKSRPAEESGEYSVR
jgi:hypothetical protein